MTRSGDPAILKLLETLHRFEEVDAQIIPVLNNEYLPADYVRAVAKSATTQAEQIDARLTQADEWKSVIIDACVVDWIFTAEHETNPRKAVNDLLCWQAKIALDPAVSKEAHDLVTRAETAEKAHERDVLRLAALTTWLGVPYDAELIEVVSAAIDRAFKNGDQHGREGGPMSRR